MQNNDQAMQEALRLAKNPAAQQLLSMLQQNGGDELQKAIEQASAGNYSQAKQAISALLDTPEAKKLLEQLGR